MLQFKVALVGFGLTTVLSACSGPPQGVNASGPQMVQKENRSVGSFSQLRLACEADVDFHQAPQVSVVVVADNNVLPLIETAVQDKILIISSRSSYSVNHPVEIFLTAPALTGTELVGSGTIHLDSLSTHHFAAVLSGSGTISGDGSGTSLGVMLEGSGQVELSRLKVSEARTSLSGSGDISLTASDSLDADLSGSGNIDCYGSPRRVHQHVSGSGRINVR